MLGTSREVERLGQIVDAELRAAIQRTGLDFEVISGGMGKASVSAINDTQAMIDHIDRLKTLGVDTALALAASFGKGINTADSQKSIELLRQQIESVRDRLGDKITNGLLDDAQQKSNQLSSLASARTDSLRIWGADAELLFCNLERVACLTSSLVR